ncbi:MAG: ABC transporter substrate-binding protein [Pseudobdellovibrionaceae bacterium]|nr:ABC transporter substrate-binding protein [Pseudobdellovibrionaceae bacterium]
MKLYNFYASCVVLACVAVVPFTARSAVPALSVHAPAASASVLVSVSEKDDQGALDFVKSTAEKGLTFLSDPESSQDQKKREFKKLLDNSFDLDTIGRFVLGKYWNSATPDQQKEYNSLFRKMVVEVYAGRFSDYKGQKFEVKSVRAISSKDALVTSFIYPESGGEPIQVDWRVRKTGAIYKVVDVLVTGVSMSVTQRSDFASVIQRGGGNIDVLIDYLKNKF